MPGSIRKVQTVSDIQKYHSMKYRVLEHILRHPELDGVSVSYYCDFASIKSDSNSHCVNSCCCKAGTNATNWHRSHTLLLTNKFKTMNSVTKKSTFASVVILVSRERLPCYTHFCKHTLNLDEFSLKESVLFTSEAV